MPTSGFHTFSAQHLVTIALTLALPVLLAVLARRTAAEAPIRRIAYVLAGVLLINEVTHWGYRLAEFGLSRFAQNHLPLHVCGIALLATAATLLFRNQRSYEIAYFWGLVGSSNAVITPGGMDAVFPEYRFFQYFISHSGIVVGTLFATWGMRMRPTLGGLFRAFVCLNAFAAGVAVLNVCLGSNYMYLCAAPAGTVSPFFFLPWPWYIAALELIGLSLFFAVYSPFLATSWRTRLGSAGRSRAASGSDVSGTDGHSPDV